MMKYKKVFINILVIFLLFFTVSIQATDLSKNVEIKGKSLKSEVEIRGKSVRNKGFIKLTEWSRNAIQESGENERLIKFVLIN